MKNNTTYLTLRQQDYRADFALRASHALDMLARRGYYFVWEPEDLSLREALPDATASEVKRLVSELENYTLFHECVMLMDPKGNVVDSLGSIFYRKDEERLAFEAEIASNFVYEQKLKLGFSWVEFDRAASLYNEARQAYV